jgi:hypothetical protein
MASGLRRIGKGARIGTAFVSKFIAFACVAAGPALCLWLAPWRSIVAQPHDAAPAIVVAGGLFTVAIAVLIRD